MIYCTKCGTSLPDDAKFCSKCGATIGGGNAASASAAAAPANAPIAAAGVQELKCPSCGAPIKPVFGEMVITCDYCGGSVTLGGQGWKEISKHTLLPLKVADQAAALKAVQAYIDTGFMHRHVFEESKVAEARLSYVPFWVMPTSAIDDVPVPGGRHQRGRLRRNDGRGRAARQRPERPPRRYHRGPDPGRVGREPEPVRDDLEPVPVPVVAVKSMTAYQPKDYQFALGERAFFDKKAIPEGSAILNGDLGEDAARNAARAYVEQLQSELAHKKHSMISNIHSQVDITEGELLHVPVWYFSLDHRGEKTVILVDGNAGRVMRTVP